MLGTLMVSDSFDRAYGIVERSRFAAALAPLVFPQSPPSIPASPSAVDARIPEAK
jgi:hypothetical protein